MSSSVDSLSNCKMSPLDETMFTVALMPTSLVVCHILNVRMLDYMSFTLSLSPSDSHPPRYHA